MIDNKSLYVNESTDDNLKNMNKGVWFGAAAYLSWGLLPAYWKVLAHIPAIEILANRIVWSLIPLLILLAVRGNWQWLRDAFANRTTVIKLAFASVLLALNWLVYIWAVNAGYLVETSLGYFINPLVNVTMGVFFLGERLRNLQWAAIALAAVGVLYMTFVYGQPPWIALTLAFTFGTYGLMKKQSTLNSLEGLSFEMFFLFLPALAYILYREGSGVGGLTMSASASFWLAVSFLLLSGVITVIPLLLFAAGARSIPLSTMGILQYIAPTLQFIMGVFLYNETFTQDRLVGFTFIWVALILYTIEGIYERRRVNQLDPAPA